jgi:lipopolysaccharide export system permease protein
VALKNIVQHLPMKNFLKPPKLLYSYLATEMLAPFFASFVVMNGVFFLIKLIPFLDFVLDLNIGFADFVRLFSYLFPSIFLYSIPMSAMMGVTIGFARLSSDSEILAFKASGISVYKILPPVIFVAGAIALLTSYFSVKLIPLSEKSMKQLTYQLLKEKITEGVKEHVFTEALGEIVVYIDKIDKNTGKWQNVWVSDTRGVANPVITMASSGSMASNISSMMVSILLENGSLHRPGIDDAQIVQFDTYQINIPLRTPYGNSTAMKRTALSMHELLQQAEIEQNPTESRKYLIEAHRRIVLPVGCLIISILGLPLGLQARPGRKAIGIQAGLGIFVLYYVLFTISRTLAENGAISVLIGMWAPNFFFFVVGIFWIYRIANEKSLLPIRMVEIIGKLWIIAMTPLQKVKVLAVRSFNRKNKAIEEQSPKDVDGSADNIIAGNAKSFVFHLPQCKFYKCRNCTIYFNNIETAIASGFEPCKFCKDLIESGSSPKSNK